MALPPGITKKLLQATSDKTDLNKQALRFNRSFKEVGKLLGSGSAKAKKDKDKKCENGSIGTSATRSTIIDSLITKGYVAEDGKRLISTELGRELYRILPDEIKKADMTAKWWAIQDLNL